MPRIILLLVLIMFSFDCESKDDYHFSYESVHQIIYQDILALKLSKADSLLKDLSIHNTENLARLHLENYLDFIRAFIQEDKKSYERLHSNKRKRIDLLKKHLSKEDPYRNYCIAEIEIQNALVGAKHDKLFRSAREIYSAYSKLKSNQSQFPSFRYHKKSLSILHALFETLKMPGLVKSLLRIDTSIEMALEEIQVFLETSGAQDEIFYEEGESIQAYILSYQQSEKEKAWQYIRQSSLDPKESALARFIMSQLAQQSGKNDEAIDLLSHSQKDDAIESFYYLEYMLGLSKLRKLDPEASKHFKTFVNNFQGEHYIKESYQKLAWCSLIFDNDKKAYADYMALVLSEGTDLLDGDIQAMNEARSGSTPNIGLLKARLLFDGAYYHKSLTHLKGIEKEFSNEIIYRKARNYHLLGDYPTAIRYYDQVIISLNKNDHRLCNAHLQLGMIYEDLENTGKAEYHFRECIKLSPKSYKRSLHQKARSGLYRIKKW